jgi:hypothetical protein
LKGFHAQIGTHGTGGEASAMTQRDDTIFPKWETPGIPFLEAVSKGHSVRAIVRAIGLLFGFHTGCFSHGCSLDGCRL